MYFVAGAAIQDEHRADRVEAMWLSLANHIQDVHEHPNQLYVMCDHGHINDYDRDKEWLVPGE